MPHSKQKKIPPHRRCLTAETETMGGECGVRGRERKKKTKRNREKGRNKRDARAGERSRVLLLKFRKKK